MIVTVLLAVVAVGMSCRGGDRAKRQVLIDDVGLNTTWRGQFLTPSTHTIVRKMFKMGAEVWSEATCIDFVENGKAKDKLVVIKSDECWSTIGRLGGDQPLSLSDNPTEGTVVHEIGHALGLLHTMARYDRDDYIRILMQNLNKTYVPEFNKVNKGMAAVYNLTYDYGSVMHYGEISFSVNGQLTVIAKNHEYQKTMGSELISFSDISMINQHYGCNEKCNKSTSAKCVNEGYPHPRNCSVCICPSGYGGALCDRRVRVSVEGENQQNTTEFISAFGLRRKPGSNQCGKTACHQLRYWDRPQGSIHFCNYMITAPEGKKVEVHVQSISSGYDEPGCPKGGVEIKAQSDQKLTGYRYCTKRGSGIPIVSSRNHLPLIFFNRLGTMEATFTYRYVD